MSNISLNIIKPSPVWWSTAAPRSTRVALAMQQQTRLKPWSAQLKPKKTTCSNVHTKKNIIIHYNPWYITWKTSSTCAESFLFEMHENFMSTSKRKQKDIDVLLMSFVVVVVIFGCLTSECQVNHETIGAEPTDGIDASHLSCHASFLGTLDPTWQRSECPKLKPKWYSLDVSTRLVLKCFKMF